MTDIKNSTVDIQTDTDTLNAFEKFKNTQKFTYGRLRDFHEYQRTHFNAPYVYFPYGNNRQVVKANIVSPRIYRAMQDDIYTSHLDTEQKRLCLVVLSLAYRTGMRIKELIGITLDDIADIYSNQTGQTIEAPVIWLKPNSHRSLKSSSAKRCIPIHCLLKPDELNCFTDLYYKQTRLKHRYLFSFGSGDHPLTDIFFSNLVKQLWDRTLDDHDLTFHSLRHTAISQLALVLKQSSLAQVMTDYDAKHCEAIIAGVLASNQNQGVWFGLASLVGHLTCDITFEYYIHTAHLLAGEQISRSRLGMPLVIFEAITGFGYQTVHRQDENAYDASSKQVRLCKIRNYLLKKLTSNDDELFTDNLSENTKNVSSQLKDNQNIANAAMSEPSIYTHAKYADVIAFLREIQGINPVNRISKLAEVALRHAININQAETIYRRAEGVFKDDRLLLGSPKGKLNQDVLVKAQSRAYQMSMTDSDALKQFTQIFTSKQNPKTSSIHFGMKTEQIALLKQFMTVGCKLIDASHWQIRSDSEEAVTELKRKLGLDNRIRTGARKNYKGFEVRVVQKNTKHSENNLAVSDDYLSSSGVLKYLGYMLMTILV